MKVAELQFRNREHVLLFRGQQVDFSDEKNGTTLSPGIFRWNESDPDSMYVINFTRVNIKREPICREHIALYWGTPSELQQLPLAPCDRLYVNNLLVSLSNE